jgi:hypothetical protein
MTMKTSMTIAAVLGALGVLGAAGPAGAQSHATSNASDPGLSAAADQQDAVHRPVVAGDAGAPSGKRARAKTKGPQRRPARDEAAKDDSHKDGARATTQAGPSR